MKSGGSDDMRHGIAQFVSALLENVDEIFATYFEKPPSKLANYWHRYLAAFHKGPPGLDRSYYFYGLLDCAAQLSTFVHPDMLPIRLRRSLIRLVKSDKVAEFRWKAVGHVLYEFDKELIRSLSLKLYFPPPVLAKVVLRVWSGKFRDFHRNIGTHVWQK